MTRRDATSDPAGGKTFTHLWEEEIFLLHLQFDKRPGRAFSARILRLADDGSARAESVPVSAEGASHRFLVTRTHPTERGFTLEWPDDVTLQAFLLDDRAYYPTESFYKG